MRRHVEEDDMIDIDDYVCHRHIITVIAAAAASYDAMPYVAATPPSRCHAACRAR